MASHCAPFISSLDLLVFYSALLFLWEVGGNGIANQCCELREATVDEALPQRRSCTRFAISYWRQLRLVAAAEPQQLGVSQCSAAVHHHQTCCAALDWQSKIVSDGVDGVSRQKVPGWLRFPHLSPLPTSHHPHGRFK